MNHLEIDLARVKDLLEAVTQEIEARGPTAALKKAQKQLREDKAMLRRAIRLSDMEV